MTRVVLLTGGNLGDIARNMGLAREMIACEAGGIVKSSSVMRSRAWGFEAREPFLNQVLVIDTELEAEELLKTTQSIERRLGRDRKEGAIGYCSRTMDIDILYYGDRIISMPGLEIPHPLISEREFVLLPLGQVLPRFRDPRTGKTPEQMLKELKG